MTASSRGSEFIPMLGLEQTLVDLMYDWLVPVIENEMPVITGQERCASQIIERLREMGADFP
jgi:hypothetical protein